MPAARTLLIYLLLAAGLGLGVWLCLPRKADPETARAHATQELLALCPGDPLLASRMATERLYVAVEVARREGADGLRAVDVFGDDAVYLFQQQPERFRDLLGVIRLDGALFAHSTGAWRKAVIEWALAGTLRHYLDCLTKLDDRDQRLFSQLPQCLPLLALNAPLAKEMLGKHGVRAWHLLMLFDCSAGQAEHVERVAKALRDYGEPMLDANEQYGLTVALLFVAPPDDRQEQIPALYRDSLARLTPAVATAIFLSNYESLLDLVREKRFRPDQLREAVDLLAGQPDELRALAADSPYTFRLVLEKDGDDPLGLAALAECGPLAAEVLFGQDGYGLQPQNEVSQESRESLATERRSALLIMKHVGWPAMERLLLELRGDDAWHRLLRRGDLHDPKPDPLIARIARKLTRGSNVQDEVERYCRMPRQQIEASQYPPRASEEALQWVPGYVAFKAACDASRGYHLENSEVAFALVDGVLTATMIGGLAGSAVKTTAKHGGQAALRQTAAELERKAAGALTKQGLKSLGCEVLAKLPGSMCAFTKNLPARVTQIDITEALRAASGIAKQVGVRTWGSLDRRIIMRGDRRVICDLADPVFLKNAGELAASQLKWGAVCQGVNELTPCLLERVIPALQTAEESAPVAEPKPEV